jgi:hypothetical protein
MEVAINMRVVDFQMGGQQRAAAEVANRLAGAIEIRPTRPLCGLEGHLWEQFALPMRAGGRLLWSPSATGPLAYSRQVVTVHDVAFLDVPECFSAAFRHLYAKVTPALMRRVAKVVTVSEFSRRRIVERTAVDPTKSSSSATASQTNSRFRTHWRWPGRGRRYSFQNAIF